MDKRTQLSGHMDQAIIGRSPTAVMNSHDVDIDSLNGIEPHRSEMICADMDVCKINDGPGQNCPMRCGVRVCLFALLH